MNTVAAVTVTAPEPSAALIEFAQQSILDRWLGTRSESTQRAYRKDLEYFARWLRAEAGFEVAGPDAAAEALLAGTSAMANTLTEAWVASQMKAGLSSATINRRLAALRSLTKIARRLGRTSVTIDTEGPRGKPVRDVRGPSDEGIRAMLAIASDQRNRRKALRDVALIRLMADCGLRRGEVVGLDPEDILGDAIRVRRKGHREKTEVPLPTPTRAALAAWLEVRDEDGEGVFHSLPHKKLEPGERRQRITGDVAWKIVRETARKAGLDRPCRPHALRHSSVTSALESGYDVRQVRHFSGHSDISTVLIYDDARRNYAREIGEAVAARHGVAS